MKTRKIIAVAGSAALMSAFALTGCSVGSEGIKLTVNGTEAMLRAELETDADGQENSDEAVDEEYYCCTVLPEEFVSTNGALEGQMDYMQLVPDCDTVDYSAYPDDDTLYDISAIEDADIRAKAQNYLDNGYTIQDPDVMREYASPFLGDGEYMFNNGFYAYLDNGEWYTSVFVFKMNETLFDYFLASYMTGDSIVANDDGTVISYEDTELNRYIEFNRDTGVAVSYTSVHVG